MKGVRSWDSAVFHPDCAGVVPVDIGGFPHLWCPRCRVLANLEAVSTKHQDWENTKTSVAIPPKANLGTGIAKGGA